ncbi:MAG TPA: SpoIIE family protein phosphatase [Polyangiaceae bacterium]|nr:SpoIIE family protein phosphatase [Polyangiaceae bacterium]
MGYLHVEVVTAQSPKRPGALCGDLVRVERRRLWTTVLCSDGMGSGVQAHLAAELHASRLLELERGGTPLRDAFGRVAHTIHQGRGKNGLYAAFSVARVLPTGEATVLSYDAPAALLIASGHAELLPRRTFNLDDAVVSESHCQLVEGEAIVMVTDGVTQAGLGTRFRNGWGIEEVARHASSCLASGTTMAELPRILHDQALQHWGAKVGDDVTAVLAGCRSGRCLTVLTGPPRSPSRDDETVREFLREDGWKVICGATTARIVARQLKEELVVMNDDPALVAPPRYQLPGIHLVTEGAITLNQVYNILEEDPERYEEDSGVTELCDLFRLADRIHFIVGCNTNPANASIAFLQRGILGRTRIVPLLRDKLVAAQKDVVIDYV